VPAAVKRIGLLFGMEDTFPWALIRAVEKRGRGKIVALPVEIEALRDTDLYEYAVIVDRISHEVPFYRTFLKVAAAQGVQLVNNPFWWSADDKYFGNIVARSIGVATPRTVLLPHKQRPANTEPTSFRNLRFVDWEAVFDYLKFPIFLKPAYGGGWKDVYKTHDRAEFFDAYDRSRDLVMMAQETIQFTQYYRCFTVGRKRARVMRYNPAAPWHERYVRKAPAPQPELLGRLERDALALSAALGYDMNTAEFAIRDGIPYAIDFTNPAPDAERSSVGEDHFEWIVDAMAEMLVERVRRPLPFELTGSWPATLCAPRELAGAS
jgi:glutathione synthase/RimK-type ligase-like ATP-grasp enzyme